MTLPREEAVIREGWLLKEGGASKSKWQSRWFVLKGRSLLWYNKAEDANPQGNVSMSDVQDVSQVGEHANKKFCVSLVTTKASSKKVYYLAAETENLMREWFSALQSQWMGDGRAAGMRLVKYATAEVFVTQGVRITGDVNYGILSTISSRVAPERKRRDGLGWFCDCPITLSTVLNLFSEYGWTPERVYSSTSAAAGESALQSVIRVIFSKSPQLEHGASASGGSRQLESSTALLRSGVFDTVTVNTQPVGLALPPGAKTLQGTDDELIELMQEFDIPLSLLLVPSS
jgi:hypothetical protein